MTELGESVPEYAEEWEDEEDEETRWPWWRALIGILITTFLMIVIVANTDISGRNLPTNRTDMLGFVAGYAGGLALFWYLILYFTALRRVVIPWKVASALIVLALTVLLTFGRIGVALKKAQGDMFAASQAMRDALDGNEVAAAPAGDRSLNGLIRDFVHGQQRDVLAYAAEVDAAGFEALANAATLKANPSVLKDCGKLNALSTSVDTYRDRWRARVATLRSGMEAIDVPQSYRDGLLEGFDGPAARNRAGIERAYEIEKLMVAEMIKRCRVLARGRWRPQGANFQFTNARDMTEFNAAHSELMRLVAEQESLQRNSAAATRKALDDVERHRKP
ncbi:hypothetical protein ACFQ1E_02200 [Sphingomonas canadensis]|uniref:Uncharacterized protein n=1 Tax=Sphingomonas canadensis TaxID=1219257 RepID=A0ABW3H144_9SPHN|nr:hypothetical protein [Sphingomonas canadensis]MCW3834947.1 hypothetical protein [Sphingomonas canadensis]